MSIMLNILIIIIAFIILLSLYLISLRRENTMEERKLQPDKTDFEAGEELGIEINEKDETEKEFKMQDYSWEENELKHKYNKTMIRLIVRDPNWLFSYWEVTNPEYYENQPVLRLFAQSTDEVHDIEIRHNVDNWYISNVKPKNRYKVAIGFKKDGIFHPLCYSNTVNTPSSQPSNIIDEKWMSIEELSKYTYRIEINSSLSLLKSLKKRRENEEEINVDSFSFSYKD